VAKIDAPTIGQAIFLPPRKKLELFSPAFLRYAIHNPKDILPIITKANTNQSRKDNDKLMKDSLVV
jgi:hypothetical protein